jgi:hypothetical protein
MHKESAMRHFEINPPASHPYIAVLRIDPVQFHELERRIQDRDEVRILHCDSSEPDIWAVHLGCASEAVAERMEDGWN